EPPTINNPSGPASRGEGNIGGSAGGNIARLRIADCGLRIADCGALWHRPSVILAALGGGENVSIGDCRTVDITHKLLYTYRTHPTRWQLSGVWRSMLRGGYFSSSLGACDVRSVRRGSK